MTLALPRTSAAPVVRLAPVRALHQSALGSPALAASLAAPSLSPLSIAMPALAPSPILAAPAAAGAYGIGNSVGTGRTDILTAGSAEFTQALADPKLSETASHQAAAKLFDGGADRAAAPPVAADEPAPSGWSLSSFRSAADGSAISYKSRRAEGSSQSPMVFVGGLALAESYDSFFETEPKAESDQYFVWLRGHQPTEFQPTQEVYEADARDMARMIVLAAERSGSESVSLALHSYGVLVFQRMVQLHKDLEVRQALRLLKGGRVTLINTTTHFGNSETAAGPQYAQMAKAIRAIVQQLDLMDAYGRALAASVKANPLLAPMLLPQIFYLQMQRDMLLSLASKGAVDELRKQLADPWAPALEHVRRNILKIVAENAATPGWQEAFLRRANATSLLDFTKEDVQRIRDYGIRLEIIHAAQDQLIPWVSAKLAFELFGFKVPKNAPKPGREFRDQSGMFHLKVVDSDHYYPLREPGQLDQDLYH